MSREHARLVEGRARLDAIDDALVDLVAERARVVAELAAWKAARGVPFHDPDREAQALERVAARARSLGLDEVAVRTLFTGLIGRRLQR